MPEFRPEATSASSGANFGLPSIKNVPEKSAGGPKPNRPQASGTANKPSRVAGNYPMREVTWYQISTSDIRLIGALQAATTVFFAIGTFLLSNYLDFSKDIILAEQAKTTVPTFLRNVAALGLGGWIGSWLIALAAFLWQGAEVRRVKKEHGELPLWGRIVALFKGGE